MTQLLLGNERKGKYNRILFTAFLFSILMPRGVLLGGLAITPTRFVLMTCCLILLPRWIIGRKDYVDLFLFLHVAWVTASFGVVHGLRTAIESGGIYFVEVFGAYLAARMTITSTQDAVHAIRVLAIVVIATLPLGIVEFISGDRIISGLLGGPDRATDMRKGFYRVYGPFGHPILYGCFCASAFGTVLYAIRVAKRRWSLLFRATSMASIVAGTVIGLTSGGLLTLLAQVAMVTWDAAVRVRAKWALLAAATCCTYLATELLSGRSAYIAILDRLTFSSLTLYYRTAIFKYGIENVYAHPFFGIGMNDWSRPEWMISSSVDNFWLLVAMRHGTPAFLSLLIAVLLVCVRSPHPQKEAQMLLLGLRISLLGLAFAATTVHLWSSALTHLAFLLGIATAIIVYRDFPCTRQQV